MSDLDEKTRVTQVVQPLPDAPGGPKLGTDCLVVIYTKEPTLLGKRFVLDQSPTRVGRGADNQIVLDGDSVSRRHAHFEQRGDAWLIDVDVPEALRPLYVDKGSIAIDGVSLTVNALRDSGVQLSIIEYTRRHTALGQLAAGSRVHIEVDVLAKHIQRLMAPYGAPLGGAVSGAELRSIPLHV